MAGSTGFQGKRNRYGPSGMTVYVISDRPEGTAYASRGCPRREGLIYATFGIMHNSIQGVRDNALNPAVEA